MNRQPVRVFGILLILGFAVLRGPSFAAAQEATQGTARGPAAQGTVQDALDWDFDTLFDEPSEPPEPPEPP
ncbi:MAG: hypothetical protein LBF63_00530 [Treponema sp.]|nr:hypothetical protein [Treponema sp.]